MRTLPSPIFETLYIILTEALDTFGNCKPVGRERYSETVGHLRDGVRMLLAIKAGCPTGLHLGSCTCKPAVIGYSSGYKHKDPDHHANQVYKRLP